MLNSEKIAIAARMHVLLRRKTGRVTDTEWMASNAAYAAEIVRFARENAATDDSGDLVTWADKLESAVLGGRAPAQSSRPAAGASRAAPRPGAPDDPLPGTQSEVGRGVRYVGGIR